MSNSGRVQLLDPNCSDGQPDSHPAFPTAQVSLSVASVSCLAGHRDPPAASSLSTANAVMRSLTATQLPLRSLCPANRSGVLQQGASTAVIILFHVQQLHLARQAAATDSTLIGAALSLLQFCGLLLSSHDVSKAGVGKLANISMSGQANTEASVTGWHDPHRFIVGGNPLAKVTLHTSETPQAAPESIVDHSPHDLGCNAAVPVGSCFSHALIQQSEQSSSLTAAEFGWLVATLQRHAKLPKSAEAM